MNSNLITAFIIVFNIRFNIDLNISYKYTILLLKLVAPTWTELLDY